MSLRTTSPSLGRSSFRNLQSSRTRMFVPGSDPLFRSAANLQLRASLADLERSQQRLLRSDFLDRLRSPLTRIHE